MNHGDTFLRNDSDRHLWVVLSDPRKNPEKVLLVNMTTNSPRKEQACVLQRGDHPWILHETCVNYGDAVVTSDRLLEEAKATAAITCKVPLERSVIERILAGAASSARLTLELAEILSEQELIDC